MENLRNLPKVDELLKESSIKILHEKISREYLVEIIRSSIDCKRDRILKGEVITSPFNLKEEVIEEIKLRVNKMIENNLKRVINCTGIVIHTNLGRSPLSERAIESIQKVSRGYSNLEYSLDAGKRGSRYDLIKEYIKILTGGEDAIVVNNNAAAVLLVLNSICKGKEGIISRGELVEIGGSFRIPDIMEASGSILREVGTTNRTHYVDYENGINENTAAILKVHKSNYKIVGFTKEIGRKELKNICRENGILLIEDLGSGLINRLPIFEEDTIREVLLEGVDIVTFSGDKLLGGPQCGIIVGKGELIQKIKNNPLNRALRVDKLTLAALEGTLIEYIENKGKNIPTIKYLSKSEEIIIERCTVIKKYIDSLNIDLDIEIKSDESFGGGGALPEEGMLTTVLSIGSKNISISDLEKYLRSYSTPIIGRIRKDRLILDCRCIEEDDIAIIYSAFRELGDNI